MTVHPVDVGLLVGRVAVGVVMLAHGRLHYARSYTCKLLGLTPIEAGDEVIDVRAGDLYIGPHRHPELLTDGVMLLTSIAEVEPAKGDKKAYALV